MTINRGGGAASVGTNADTLLASKVVVTPVGNLAATNGQSAFQELDADLTTEIARAQAAEALLQPLDSELTALAGLTSAADKLPYFTGSGAAALADLSTFVRTLTGSASAAAAAATLLVPSLANLADTATAGLGTALIGWIRAATGAVATTLKQWLSWQSYHVLEFMSTAQRADVLAGTAAVDVTAAITAACTAIQSAGGGRLEFGNYRYAIYGTPSTTPLGAFSSLRGIELAASGAEFVVTGNFETFADVAPLFKFTACNNITIGDFKGTYSGAARSEIFTRGAQFAQFEQGCANVRIGSLDLSDWALGVRFQALYSDPTSYRCRNIRIANIKATNVGYPLTTDNSGDELEAQINSTGCGRSWIAYNPKNCRVLVRSKNQVASSDCLLYAFHGGVMEGVNLFYTNTESTDTSGGTRIGVTVAFRDGDVAAAIIRNVDIKLNITQEGGGFLGNGLIFEKLVAAGTVDTTDRGHEVQNFRVSGRADTNSSPIGLFDSTGWSTSDFVRNIVIEDLELDGGQPFFHLTSLVDTAIMRNVTYDSALNVIGNTTGKVVLTGVKATEITTATSDTSLMDFYSCQITTGTNLSFIGKNYTDTLIAGALYSGPKKLIRNSQSTNYTLTLADANKMIWHPGSDGSARTFTIPANASVAFPIGTQITIVNSSSFSVTIAITSDTLVLAGAGITGSRTLAVDSVARLIKADSTVWYVSGDSGLT